MEKHPGTVCDNRLADLQSRPGQPHKERASTVRAIPGLRIVTTPDPGWLSSQGRPVSRQTSFRDFGGFVIEDSGGYPQNPCGIGPEGQFGRNFA